MGLAHSQKIIARSNYSIEDYLKREHLLSDAHNSYIWVIEPNGHSYQAGFAYWNSKDSRVKPGSILFIGFSSGFFNLGSDRLEKLESDIVFLLSNAYQQ